MTRTCFILFFFFFTIRVNAGSIGTGFLVSGDGLIATSNHVIDEATSISVEFKGKEYLASKVAQDEANDLAIVKIEGEFPFLQIKGSEEAKVGDEIFTVGYPNPELQGYEPKMTTGVISSMSGLKDDPTCYQISSPVQPGNSGGPLLAKEGEVLGIIKSKLSAKAGLITSGSLPENVNYAVKSDYLNLLVKMAKNKVRSLKRQDETKPMSPIDKALSCIVLIKAKNEKYQGEKTQLTKAEPPLTPTEYLWEKRFKDHSEFISTHEGLEKIDMDEPLETYDKIGNELLSRGEISQDQAKFFQEWRANTSWGAIMNGTHWFPSNRNPRPYEQEWERMKKLHNYYLDNKEGFLSYSEKLTYMKMMKPKLKARGLKLLAEEYENQWIDDNPQIEKMRANIMKQALESAKRGGLFLEAKIVARDSTGFAYTDPTINNDQLVEVTTTNRFLSNSKATMTPVLQNNEELIERLVISIVSNDAFRVRLQKRFLGEIEPVSPGAKQILFKR